LFEGKANVPSRIILNMPNNLGNTLFKPAYMQSCALGLKIVSVRPNNTQKGLPTVPGFVILSDEDTGLPKVLMDGTYITALRSAAGSAVATDILARKNASILCVFGAGMQAKSHIEAICCVRDIQQVFIVNRTIENAEKLAQGLIMKYPKLKVSCPIDPKEALQMADIIITATNTITPLFSGKDVPFNRVHINAVGSYTPQMQELDSETIRRSKVVIDTEEALESGDLQIPMQQGLISTETISGTLGQIISQNIQVRDEKTDITLFKSVGSAVQDIATASAILRAAEAKNLGIYVSL